jgi:hypothetical protein
MKPPDKLNGKWNGDVVIVNVAAIDRATGERAKGVPSADTVGFPIQDETGRITGLLLPEDPNRPAGTTFSDGVWDTLDKLGD